MRHMSVGPNMFMGPCVAGLSETSLADRHPFPAAVVFLYFASFCVWPMKPNTFKTYVQT